MTLTQDQKVVSQEALIREMDAEQLKEYILQKDEELWANKDNPYAWDDILKTIDYAEKQLKQL